MAATPISAVVSELNPDALEHVANSLAEAAQKARKKCSASPSFPLSAGSSDRESKGLRTVSAAFKPSEQGVKFSARTSALTGQLQDTPIPTQAQPADASQVEHMQQHADASHDASLQPQVLPSEQVPLVRLDAHLSAPPPNLL